MFKHIKTLPIMSSFKKLAFTSGQAILLWSLIGCNPIDPLYKEIKKYGYIPYTTPLQYAGTGTLVGGSPSSLSLIASPETCFPNQINGVPTNLRQIDDSTLPHTVYKVSANGNANIKLFNFLSIGNPIISAGAQFGIVKTTELSMEGVHIEYMDSIKLSEYYPQMPAICREYLKHVGFIIQAIKVDKLSFKFYSSSGGAINLNLQNIQEIVNISANATWNIENSVTLNITTPKYIGYQLGKLQEQDQGLVLYRATRTVLNKFHFDPIDIFDNYASGIAKSLVNDSSTIPLKELDNSDYIDLYSTYAPLN